MQHEELIVVPRNAMLISNAFACAINKIGRGIEFIHDQFREHSGPDACETPEELREYARKIQHTDPSLSSELMAIANHAEDLKG